MILLSRMRVTFFFSTLMFIFIFILYFAFSAQARVLQALSTVKIDDTTSNGPVLADDDSYGTSIVGIGDLNGDGVEDVVVGANRDDTGGGGRGAIHISYMNTDGSIDSTVKIDDTTANGPVLADNDNYGTSVANIGDLNNDGVIDLAVGAFGDDTGGNYRGAAYIHFMNTDGSIDSTVKIDDSTANGPALGDSDFYGFSIAGIGDLDGDSVEDIAVGAMGDDAGGTDRGSIHISFMNTNGSIHSTVEINTLTNNGPALTNSDNYGTSIANVSDLNNDGVTDIAVGAPLDNSGGSNRGAVYIHYMNTNGSLDSTEKIDDTTSNGPVLANEDYYGSAIANLGDMNQDGVDDFLVGAKQDSSGGNYRGGTHLHFMNTTGSVDSTIKVDDTVANGPVLANEDFYGAAVTNIGDLNGDGFTDIAVGTPGDDTGSSSRGAIHISFLALTGSNSAPEIISSATPVNISLTYDSNICYALGDSVPITQSGDNIAQQTIADNDLFIGSSWEPYTPETKVILTKEGINTFYFLYLASGKGNVSNVQKLEIAAKKECTKLLPVSGLPEGIKVGDLIKATDSDTVYWIQEDEQRHEFLYDSLITNWFTTCNEIKTISPQDMVTIPSGDIVLPKPGTWIQIEPELTVYEVGKDGVTLRIVDDAERLRALQDPAYEHTIFVLDERIAKRFVFPK